MARTTTAAILAAFMLTGCAGSVGVISPVVLTAETVDGEIVTEIGYETRGIQWGNGDASAGPVSGGHVSEPFSAFFDNTIGALAHLVGGLLPPFGAISTALSEGE